MPDDRPESPEEVVLGVLNDYRVGYTAPFKPDAMDRYRANLAAAITAALSTPAGPEPKCPECGGDGVIAKRGPVFPGYAPAPCPNCAAPSPREEAVEPWTDPAFFPHLNHPVEREEAVEAGRVYWIVACAECGAQFQPVHARNGVDPCGCFGAHAPRVISVPLSAARPSSPTPEETR